MNLFLKLGIKLIGRGSYFINKITTFLTSNPGILFIGGIILYVVGYVSVMVLGPHNVVEEVAEVVLKKEFNIEVEFDDEKR